MTQFSSQNWKVEIIAWGRKPNWHGISWGGNLSWRLISGCKQSSCTLEQLKEININVNTANFGSTRHGQETTACSRVCPVSSIGLQNCSKKAEIKRREQETMGHAKALSSVEHDHLEEDGLSFRVCCMFPPFHTIFQLSFDRPRILWIGGMELLSTCQDILTWAQLLALLVVPSQMPVMIISFDSKYTYAAVHTGIEKDGAQEMFSSQINKGELCSWNWRKPKVWFLMKARSLSAGSKKDDECTAGYTFGCLNKESSVRYWQRPSIRWSRSGSLNQGTHTADSSFCSLVSGFPAWKNHCGWNNVFPQKMCQTRIGGKTNLYLGQSLLTDVHVQVDENDTVDAENTVQFWHKLSTRAHKHGK